ncbi:MAG: class I SAM-dependent methyltransferase [Candidatus Dormibacter sp.]
MEKRRRLARWLRGDGIEIGALHHPLAVPATARVTYVDRLPEQELRRHYQELASEKFAPVTMIGNAEDLSAFSDNSQDFVIANHLLEHLEDPIRALVEFHRVLRPDGVLYMALPDPRANFDRDRQLTTLAHLLEEHRSGTDKNRLAHYLDWAQHADNDEQPERRAATLMAMDYSIHFHVWLPDTFLEFLLAARHEAQLDLELAAFAPPESPEDNEFIVILLKGASRQIRLPSPVPWWHLLDRSVWHRIRRRVKESPAGPALRPIYERIKRRSSAQ